MRTIVKRLPARTVTSYRCGACNASYRSASGARRCEAGGTEPLAFRKGDLVRAIARRTTPSGRTYVCLGRITAIGKPVRYDSEIFMKGFGIEGRYGHLRWYTVAYRLPGSDETQTANYPAAALKRL